LVFNSCLRRDDVAQIPVLEVGVDLFAHGIAGDVELDAAGGVLHGGEAGLAHHALEHHAAGHADGHGGGVQGFGILVAVFGDQGSGAVLGLEVVGEGDAAMGLGRLAQGLEFFAALGDEFVFVLRGGVFCRRRGVLFSHEKRAPATSAGWRPETGAAKMAAARNR
jgi:hypothetical protein